MELTIVLAVLAVAGLSGAGISVWMLFRAKADGKIIENARDEARGLRSRAEDEKRKTLIDTQEEVLLIRTDNENEIKQQRQELGQLERRFLQREEQLEAKNEELDRERDGLSEKQLQMNEALAEVDELKVKQTRALEQVSGLSASDAHEMVMLKAEEEAQHDLAQRYYEMEKETKARADENARNIITLAINRLSTDVVSETTTSVVSLPNDEMKGRLIGREGRNIRALEALTGVDIVIDDTPEIVTVSCFDPVRREIAKLSLEKLVSDGRIQPARIEDMFNKAQTDVEQTISKQENKQHLTYL